MTTQHVQGAALGVPPWEPELLAPALDTVARTMEQCEFKRMRTDEEIRWSEQHYRDLMDAVATGVFRVNRQGVITFANRHAGNLIGIDSSDLVGSRLEQWLAASDVARFRVALGSAFETRQPVSNFETRLLVSNALRHLAVNAVPVRDASGQLVEVQLTGIDITEEKRLEERYFQAQKMESVGRLAGSMAHDFNNLLTAIMGYAELIQAGLPADSPLMKHVQEVLNAGDRSTRLIRQLLTFSKQQPTDPKVMDVNELIQGMDGMLRRIIGEDLELHLDLAPKACQVKIDPGLLEQVLLNLVVNARDAMPNGGALTIETRNIEASERHPGLPDGPHPGERVAVLVRDTGHGMSDKVRQHLFEPFFTTKPHGTGLGLATCYGIVHQAGGEIRVTSQVGMGTTMEVYLPRCTEDSTPPYAGVAPPSRTLLRGTETIMVVEDEASVRTFVTRFLSGLGYTIVEASDGVQALQLLEADPGMKVDLLLTDAVMPKMGGVELAIKVQSLRPKINVLFMSGYTEGQQTDSRQEQPTCDFLEKPFSVVDLAAKIRTVLAP